MHRAKKTVIALATIASLAAATTGTAQAGPNWWKKPLATGIGIGVGVGLVGALTQPRPQTVVVGQPVYQPRCYTQAQQMPDAYGVYRVQYVQICQ